MNSIFMGITKMLRILLLFFVLLNQSAFSAEKLGSNLAPESVPPHILAENKIISKIQLLYPDATVVYREQGAVLFTLKHRFQYSRPYQGPGSEISDVGILVVAPGFGKISLNPMEQAQGSLHIYNRVKGNTRVLNTPEGRITDSKKIRAWMTTYPGHYREWLEKQEWASPNQLLSFFDFSNNFGNKHHVSFARGRLFSPEGEDGDEYWKQNFDKPFFSLIQHLDGKWEMNYVLYEIETVEKAEGYDRVFARAYLANESKEGLFEKGEELKEVFSFCGLPVLKEGQAFPMGMAVRGGLFQDVRHLVLIPPAKGADLQIPGEVIGGVFLGVHELSENNFDKLYHALTAPVRLRNELILSLEGTSKTVPLEMEQTRRIFNPDGYTEVSGAPQHKGEYRFLDQGKMIEVFFLPKPNPNVIQGLTTDNDFISISIGGASGRVGITFGKEMTQFLSGLGVKDAFSIAQGTGGALSYILPQNRSPDKFRTEEVVPFSEGRRGSSCTVLVSLNESSTATEQDFFDPSRASSSS